MKTTDISKAQGSDPEIDSESDGCCCCCCEAEEECLAEEQAGA